MHRVFPAEWAPQGAVLLIWPHEGTDWADRLTEAEKAFAALAAAITRYEPIVVVCRDRKLRERALQQLLDIGCSRAAVGTVLVDSDDTWARDIAPIGVLDDGLPLVIDWEFNGWGGRYPHKKDGVFGYELIDSAGFATLGYQRAPAVLEGGAVDTDGAGTLLVNRPTILGPTRNPNLDEASAEALLQRYLGIDRTLWIDVPPLAGDDTDGHIDTLARFCGPKTIAHAAPCTSGTDPNAGTLAQLAEQLTELRTADGEPYGLIPLPGPEPITDHDRNPCPATYANFLIVNGAVLVPSYAEAADGPAAERLQEAFPERA
ncbi:MAG: agmatine deiminase family protein, partial [Halofilum sp. (in: g-proteobacteria)]